MDLQKFLQNLFNSTKEKAPEIAKKSLKQAKKAAPIVGTALSVSIVTAILVHNYDDKIYRELMKKHDRDTAKRMTEQFKKEIEALENEISMANKDKEQAKQMYIEKVRDLCDKFGVNPDEVLKSSHFTS